MNSVSGIRAKAVLSTLRVQKSGVKCSSIVYDILVRLLIPRTDTLLCRWLQATNVAAVSNTLLHPEAMQALLAGQRKVAAAASDVPAAALGNTQGVGTMQELLLSLRAAAAAGGGDVQRMFGAF